MIKNLLFAVALVLAWSPALSDASQESDQKLDMVSPDEFLSVFEDLRADLEDGVPRKLTRREWREFDRIHDRFQSILDGVDDATELPDRQQLTLYNLQNELDGLIMGGAREQLVCTEQRSVGSRIPRRQCRTVAEIEDERARSRQWLQSFPLQLEGPSG